MKTMDAAALAPSVLWVLSVLSALSEAGEPPKPKPPVEISLSTQAKWNAFTAAEALETKSPIAVSIKLKNNTAEKQDLRCTIEVKDYWGKPVQKATAKPVAIDPNGTAEVKDAASFVPPGLGAFDVTAKVTGTAAAEKLMTAIVVPNPRPGLRPESFFASNTGAGGHSDFHQRIGLRVYRQHFADMWQGLAEESKKQRPPNAPVRFDFDEMDKYVMEAQRHGISIVGIVGYANPEWARSPEAQRLRMYGPPRDLDEFIRTTVPVVDRYRQIRYWEFWNEPWIYGWTWAGSSAEYRRFQRGWAEAARQVRPDLQLIVGHSASFFVDNITPDPACFRGLVVAVSNHPYKEGERNNLRRGSQVRYTDYGVREAIRHGINLHFITENGTEVAGLGEAGRDHPLNAVKLVVMHAMLALTGEYQMNVQEGIGWGLDQMRGSAAYAVMTHRLEDRVPVADIWPAHPLIWGALFANPEHADPSLPRASEFNARWKVPGRPGDASKVAVLWCNTGPDEDHLDKAGTLTLSPAGDLAAFDLMGNPTGARRRDALTIPFTEYPVYVTSDKLTVKQMYELIRDAKIEDLTPVNLYAYSLTKPLDQKPDLVVRIQNQMNRPLACTLRLKLPDGWRTEERRQDVTLEPAELSEVTFHLQSAQPNATNLYPITLSADTDAGRTRRDQVIQVAYAPSRTIAMTGKLDDWKDIVPVTVDSDWFAASENWTQLVLNPNLPRPKAVADKARIVARGYTAWDKDHFYVAFAVQEPDLKQNAGKPYRDTKYTSCEPDGIGFPFYSGDAVQFAFGIRERAEDDYRKPGDPWYWKGCFRDTDYQYIAYTSEKGPKLIRLAKPGIPYRVGFQTETQPGQGPVEGAKILINRVGDTSFYEISLPRAELALLEPEEQSAIRFGFVLSNDEGVGAAGRLQWSQAAGVFDYWFNNGSYQPTWESFWAAQTRWGLGK